MTTPGTQRVHVLAPAKGVHNPKIVNGRTYSASQGSIVAVPVADASTLIMCGWADMGRTVGPSSERPPAGSRQSGIPITADVGSRHWDETLGAEIVFDGSTWRDSNGAAV